MDAYEKEALAQATLDVAMAILLGAGEAMKRHGDDPLGVAILAAGFVMAIDKTTSIDPHIRHIVVEMLGR